MKLGLSHLQNASFYLKEQLHSSLAPQTTKILMIAAIAFCSIAALFIYCYYHFVATKDPKKAISPATAVKVNTPTVSPVLTAQQLIDLQAIFNKEKKQFPHQAKRLDMLYSFLTQDNYTYSEADYDMGFEDNFGVKWIFTKNPADKKFLEQMSQKYPNAIKELEVADPAEMIKDSRIGVLNQDVRLANNNIYCLLLFSQNKKCPEIQMLLKEAMIYCLLKTS